MIARKYDCKIREWVEATFPNDAGSSQTELARYTVLTYNVLFDYYGNPRFADRIETIIENIKGEEPTIICLQEITPRMLTMLLNHPYFQTDFYCVAEAMESFGQITFSRVIPVQAMEYTFPGASKKSLHFIEVYLGSGDITTRIMNVHLTSDYKGGNKLKRRDQLRFIHNVLAKSESFICVGDFNATASDTDMLNLNEMDAHVKLHGPNGGYTYNSIVNPLAAQNSPNAIVGRLDRVLFKGEMDPDCIQLVGTNNCVSDHFGVSVTFHDRKSNVPEIDPILSDFNQDRSSNGALCVVPDASTCSQLKTFLSPDSKFPIHVSVFRKVPAIEEWLKMATFFQKYLSDYGTFPLDTVTIFNHEAAFSVVFTSSKPQAFLSMRSDLERFLKYGVGESYLPHVTLRKFDDELKAKRFQQHIKEWLEVQKSIIIETGHLEYMQKIGPDYEIHNHRGKFLVAHSIGQFVNALSVPAFVEHILKSMNSFLKFEMVGSRVFEYSQGDWDLVVSGPLENKQFFENMLLALQQSSEIVFTECIDASQAPHINATTKCNQDINILFYSTLQVTIPKHIRQMLSIEVFVKDTAGDRFQEFCLFYIAIRRWASCRKVCGANFGLLNGIAYVMLCLNIMTKNPKVMKSRKMFKLFFEIYSAHDWTNPIGEGAYTSSLASDFFMIILDPFLPETNIVRKMVFQTKQLLRNEFQRANILLNGPNVENDSNFQKVFLTRKLKNRCIKITVGDYDFTIGDEIKIQNRISSSLWKLLIKESYLLPNGGWKNGVLRIECLGPIDVKTVYEAIANGSYKGVGIEIVHFKPQ